MNFYYYSICDKIKKSGLLMGNETGFDDQHHVHCKNILNLKSNFIVKSYKLQLKYQIKWNEYPSRKNHIKLNLNLKFKNYKNSKFKKH